MKIINTFKLTILIFLSSFLILLPSQINAQVAGEDGMVDITDDTFDNFNPLKIANKTAGVTVDEDLTTPGGIISRMLVFSFPLAGFILFIMLFWGGFEIVYGASTSKSMEAGKNRITTALIGFFFLFASYWIIQILEEVFGITIFI